MNSRKFLPFIFLSISTLIFSQSNQFLKPVQHPLFSNLNSDYYYLLRATLIQKDYPTLALLKTSHLPESIFYVSHDLNDGKYYVNFKIAKSSIWEKYYDRSKKKIQVDSWRKNIDTNSFESLKKLFDYNLYNTKYDINYKEYFDGEQYLFLSDRKTGFIEDVAENSDVYKAIKICEKLIEQIKTTKGNKFIITTELKNEIDKIVNDN